MSVWIDFGGFLAIVAGIIIAWKVAHGWIRVSNAKAEEQEAKTRKALKDLEKKE